MKTLLILFFLLFYMSCKKDVIECYKFTRLTITIEYHKDTRKSDFSHKYDTIVLCYFPKNTIVYNQDSTISVETCYINWTKID